MNIDYIPLFTIFLIAWSVPILLSWMGVSKVPAIVVEIAMGVAVGPFALGWVSGQESYLDFLSHTGFLFLIFLSGLALDTGKIVASFPRRLVRPSDFLKNTFLLALLIYIASIILSFLLVYFVPFFRDMDIFFMTILLPSVALSIVVPVLKSDEEIDRKFGQVLLLEGALATIATILLVAVYVGVYKRGGFELKLLLFLAIFVLFFIAYRVGKLLVRIPLFKRLLYQLEHAASQIQIRGALALLLLFVIVSDSINTEPVLGAFFAGVLLSIFMPKERSALLFKLEGMGYGFFIPIFFIMVGVELDVASLKHFGSSVNFILILTGGFFAIQLIPSVFLMPLFGFRKAASSGILLTSRLGLTIATAQIGLSLELLSTADNAGIVTASILTCILAPALYKYMNQKKDRHHSVYIMGSEKTGIELAERLKMHGISYLIITADRTTSNDLKALGINALYAPEGDANAYRQHMTVRPMDHIVVLMGSDEKNIELSELLKRQLGHSKIITVMEDAVLSPQRKASLEELQLIDIHQIVSSHLENEIMRPVTAHALMDSFGAYSVEEILLANVAIENKYIKDIPFPQSGSLVVIRREDDIFIPHGDTRLMVGDLVTVIGNTSALIKFRQLLL